MVNVLLEGYDIGASWIYSELKNYLKSTHKVAVVAFSFRDSKVKNLEDWNGLYGKENGKFYKGIVSGFKKYGILEENISFLNYFTDTQESAKEKIKNADVIFFLSGLPDKMMERIIEFDLYDVLIQHKGIVMGYSAGALIQLAEYHITPDHDYPEFGYYKGLPYLDGFYLEVHYSGKGIQKASIKRVIEEKNKPVYVTALMKGGILVDNGVAKILGDVKKYN